MVVDVCCSDTREVVVMVGGFTVCGGDGICPVVVMRCASQCMAYFLTRVARKRGIAKARRSVDGV